MSKQKLIDKAAIEAMKALIALRHPDHSGQNGAEQLASDAYAIGAAMELERKNWIE